MEFRPTIVCRPVSTKAFGIPGNKKPHRLIGSEVSEISFVNQNPTAALLSSSALASSRMFKFRITAQNVLIVCTRVNGIFAFVLNGLIATPLSAVGFPDQERKL